MSAKHLLHATMNGVGGGLEFRLECCDPNTETCATYHETTWPSESDCNCTTEDCPCRDGDHEACPDYSYTSIGVACRLEREDKCFLLNWFDEMGTEMLDDGGWPDDPHFPLPVDWNRDGDNPILEFSAENAEPTFEQELEALINRHSDEVNDTPDAILATYMFGCLAAYRDAINTLGPLIRLPSGNDGMVDL